MLKYIKTKNIAGYEIKTYEYKNYQIKITDGKEIDIIHNFSNDISVKGLNIDNLRFHIDTTKTLSKNNKDLINSELQDLLDLQNILQEILKK